jgi:hypothetical protein
VGKIGRKRDVKYRQGQNAEGEGVLERGAAFARARLSGQLALNHKAEDGLVTAAEKQKDPGRCWEVWSHSKLRSLKQ